MAMAALLLRAALAGVGQQLGGGLERGISAGPQLEMGIIYVQPSYHFASTLDLDLAVLRKDLDVIASAGFVNVGVRTSWGEIMSKWDGDAGEPTWNEDNCAKLAAVAAECAKRKLRLIFNTHLRDTVPEGVEGAFLVNHTTLDSRGVVQRPYWSSTFVDHMVRDSYREPMIQFHTKFAQCLKESPTVPRFWKHAFESTYVFPQKMTSAQVAKTAPAANEKFRRWAQDTNPDIAHWAQRWNESVVLHSFSQITIPHLVPEAQHACPPAKFGDYWRFWLLGVLKEGKYGMSIGDIYGGLADGAGQSYVPGLAFKHWKPKNLVPPMTDLSPTEIKEAFDLPINATALGYYVDDAPSLAKEPASFQAYVRSVKEVAPPALPLIIWETGASTWNLTEAQQASWAAKMMATAKAEGVAGFNWWQFVDWAPIPAHQPCTQSCAAPPCNTQCQLLHFGAHKLDGSPKAVWDVLKTPPPSDDSRHAPPHANANGPPPECHPADLPMASSRGGSAQIVGPTKFDGGSIAAWLSKMKDMRTKCMHAVGYDATAKPLSDPTLKWTQTAYIGPQMHPWDRFFYNESLGNGTNGAGYTINKWLGDLNKRYGGIDQALIWPTYTNIGIDDRNTFDLIRSMPGGAAGLKVVVDQLHAKGVKVLWPYHPWDSGTHGQERNNETDFLAMAHLLQDTGSDGFNGDTMQHIPKAFVDASYSIGYKAIAMQAEGGLIEWNLPYSTIGWGEGWTSGAVYVDKPKWLTKGLATTAWCSRWSGVGGHNRHAIPVKLPQIQINWFNGLGYETWENVWGTWNGLIERSAEAIRRVGMMLRFFGHRTENFFASPDWIPFTAEGAQMEQGVFVSAFPRGKETVYTFINWNENKNGTVSKGVQLNPATKAAHYYDCYNGIELTPDAKTGALSFDILANGFGCVIATPNATTIDHAAGARTLRAMHAGITGGAPSVPTTLSAFLGTMAVMTKKPLAEYDNYFHYLPQVMVNGNETTKIRPLHDNATDEVYISGGRYDFKATGIEDRPSPPESGNDVQFPWEPYPRRAHEKTLQMSALYVDKYPVTNAKYAAYIQASKYVPKDRQNWLKHSFDFPAGGTGQPNGVKPGWEQKPVTYVSVLDAQAYCAHEGKRLPSVIEWQYFAQGGNSSLIYPWGIDDNANFTPAVNNDWTNPGPEPVGAHPEGGSVDGIQDLVRSVWQMTSVFEDDHTRSVLLRGGSNYGPWRSSNCRWIENDDGTPREQAPACWATATTAPVPGSKPHFGSHWYFAPAFELNTYNKYYIMGGSYDRAGTIGFRCVADAKDDCGTDQKLCVDVEPLVDGANVDLDAAAGTSAMASDWVHFTQKSGYVPVRMDHGATPRTEGNSLTIGFDTGGVETGVVVASANGTGFSWKHGEAAPGPVNGTNDYGGVLIGDASVVGGVSIHAPQQKTPMTLTAYFGPSTGGRNGVLTATSSGFSKTLDIDIEPEGGIVSIAYDATASDLTVRVSNGGGAAPCAMAQLISDGSCIGAITTTNGADLSRRITGSDDTLLDWKHWGGINESGPAPKDWGVGDGPEGWQKTGLIQNATCSNAGKPCTLRKYSKAAGTYSWTVGANEISGKGGVFSEFGTNGGFSMMVLGSEKTKGAVQRLKLYVGACGMNAKLVVQSTGAAKKMITTKVPKAGGTRNFVWTIDFIGDVMVGWGPDGDHDGGNLTWQAATLETVASGDKKSQGLVLQSLVWGQ